MNNTNTGGPAFPNEGGPGNLWNEKGMTLRDYFAAKAIDSLLDQCPTYESTAIEAYKMADAMLKAREA